jgi:hypothetical protein
MKMKPLMTSTPQLQKDWIFHLNAFLSKCDSNYTAGRALWKLWSYDTAGNLLWLSIEQLAKIIITQTEIANNNLIRESELIQLKQKKNNTKEFCTIISKIFKRINGNHSVNGLISNSSLELKSLLKENIQVLKNINELYINRYYVPRNGTTTYGNWIDDVDKLYFEMRALISEEMPAAEIDIILFDVEFGQPLILPMSHQLVKDNKFLKNRKYPRLNKALTVGGIVSFDGVSKV